MMRDLKSLILSNDFDAVEKELAHNADCAGTVGVFNIFSQKSLGYPLHYLCRKRDTPLSTMRSMINASPPKAFVYRESSYLSTALHLACWYQLSAECILLLLESSKEALLMEDLDGNLPLHIAAALHPQADVLVTAFLTLRPETALRQNAKAQTPLHSLCTREKVPIQLLRRMISTAPNAAGMKDRMGRLPIHHACLQHQAELDVLECLLRAYPRAVRVHDHAALTPYGIARRRWGWPTRDPRVQLLRKDMIQASPLPVAWRNQIQFKLEDWSAKKSHVAIIRAPSTTVQ